MLIIRNNNIHHIYVKRINHILIQMYVNWSEQENSNRFLFNLK